MHHGTDQQPRTPQQYAKKIGEYTVFWPIRELHRLSVSSFIGHAPPCNMQLPQLFSLNLLFNLSDDATVSLNALSGGQPG